MSSAGLGLVGECNRCGLCCMSDDRERMCEYLEHNGDPGTPESTRCVMYRRRYDGMPIRIVDREHRVVEQSVCHKDSAAETAIILPKIGKGCSLQTVEAAAQINVWQPTGGVK